MFIHLKTNKQIFSAYIKIFCSHIHVKLFDFNEKQIQARLFRVFQTVLHAKQDTHNEELQRLAVFIVKQFVQIAPNNPKIFAELLFFKSIREAEMVSNGYEDVYK